MDRLGTPWPVLARIVAIAAAGFSLLVPATGSEAVSAQSDASGRFDALLGADRVVVGFTLAQVGPGAAVLTTGLTVPDRSAPRTLLVRAAGPALATLGATGTLAHPKLAIFDAKGRRVTAPDDRPADAAIIRAAARAVGTFPFPEDSLDAALVVELAPGRYTVQVGSADGDTGVALLEVFDVTPAVADAAQSRVAAGVNSELRTTLTPGLGRLPAPDPQLRLHLPLAAGFDDIAGGLKGIRATAVNVRDGAAWFDGKQSQLLLPHVALDRRAFAIAMWIKLEDDFPSVGLVQERAAHRRNQHFHLVMRNATPRLGFYGNDLQTATPVKPQDGWTHLVFQYTGRQQEIWKNGRLLGRREARPYLGTTGEFVVGKAPRWVNVPAHDFKGGMRDLRVYSRSLAPIEIGALAKQ